MPHAQTLEETERRARALLEQRTDARMAAVRDLVKSRTHLDQAREIVRAAELDDARAYAGAAAMGWSREELASLGLKEPDKVARVQRRATRQRTAAPAAVAPAAPAPPTAE